MDEYLKIKLDKMTEQKRGEVLDYLLGVQKNTIEERKRDYRLVSAADYLDKAIAMLKARQKQGYDGIISGYPGVDRLTQGFGLGELTVIAAKTSVGKTAFAANIANNVAANGIPVLFVTLETPREYLTERLYSINGEDYEKTQAILQNIVYQKTNRLDWRSVDGLISNFCNEMNNGLVIIDHLHYFSRELERHSEDLGRVTMELKKNAEQHKVPVLLISHVRKNGDEEITMEDLRGSSYIAQDADIVLLLGKNQKDPKLIAVRITKNRNKGYDPSSDYTELRYSPAPRLLQLSRSTLGGFDGTH